MALGFCERRSDRAAMKFLFLLAVACNDTGVGIRNDTPAVTFVSPTSGEEVVEGASVELVALVADEQEDIDDLTYVWTSSNLGVLTGETVFEEDVVRFVVPKGFAVGEETVTLTVVDRFGSSGEKSRTFVLVPNSAPVVRFDSPADGSIFADIQTVSLAIHADDAHDDASGLSVVWSGLPEALPAGLDSDGNAAVDVGPLAAGDYAVSVTVTDSNGGVGTAALAFQVEVADADVDGFVASAWGGDDCDDADPAVHPGSEEWCDGRDEDCDGEVDEDANDALLWHDDADGDSFGDPVATSFACEAGPGVVADDTDCDDADVDVHPAADEICNELDDNCDGTVDENASLDAGTWYSDADADGYGDSATSTVACDPPPASTGVDGDCDDTEAAVNPGATERCNGGDDDCDGTVDEADAVDAPTWYADTDGDGYGDAGAVQVACDAPAGAVADSSDCDDAVAAANPGEDELCNGFDDDCDGSLDEGDALDALVIYEDGDGDGWGNDSVSMESCSLVTGYAIVGKDCDDTEASVSPAGTEVCGDGLDNDCDGGPGACEWSGVIPGASADAKLTGPTSGEAAGTAAAIVNDFDGDGFDEVLVGAPYHDGAGSNAGAVYLFDGGPTGATSLGSADATMRGESAADRAGEFVAGASDLDGDGYGDLIVGSMYDDDAGGGSGAMYLYYGSRTGLSGTTSLSAADLKVRGVAASDNAGGAAAAIGDFDGDGVGDVVLGAALADTGGSASGTAYVVPGGSVGVQSAGSFEAFYGTAAKQNAAGAVGGGDLDGDGLSEVVVGAIGTSTTDGGWVFVVGGGSTSSSLTAADAILSGEAINDQAGAGVCVPGDLNGDGRDDLVVSAPRNDRNGTDAGAFYAWFTLPSGAVSVALADVIISGESRSDRFGESVSLAGDVNGDGALDLLVGATDSSATGGSHYGFYGPLTASTTASNADFRFDGDTADDTLGYAAGGSGDLDGDGYDDLAIGAPGDDDSFSGSGAVFLLYGAGL